MDNNFNIDNLQSNLDSIYYNNLLKALEKSSYANDSNIRKKIQEFLNSSKEQSKESDTSTDTKPTLIIKNNMSSQSLTTLSETSPSYSDDYLYQKPWTKLTQIHKVIKIKEFVNTKLNIEDEKEKQELRDKLVDKVKNKELTKKESVNYDSIKGIVISIPKLEYKNGKYIV
jgi:hypothetical protein